MISIKPLLLPKHSIYFITLMLFVINVLAAFSFAQTKAIHAPFYHLDGAFQTASGLFHLAHGELPGKDFLPYLGIGLLYLIYPCFYLAGSNLAASVFASHFICAMGYLFSLTTITALCSNGNQKLNKGFAIAALSWVFHYYYIPGTWGGQYYILPGNSLRPLRCLIAYLAVAAVYIVLKTKLSSTQKFRILGTICGVCLLWSNDFSLITALCISLFLLVWAYINNILSITLFFNYIGSAVCSAFILFWISTGGHISEIFNYNFNDVLHDQFWYFGSWSSPYRLFNLADLQIKLIPYYSSWLFVLPFTITLSFTERRLELVLLSLIGVITLFAGFIASYGGHIGGYEFSYIFWAKTTMILLCFSRLTQIICNKYIKNTDLYLCYGTLVIILLSGFYTYEYHEQYQLKRKQAYNDSSLFFVSELGGFLARDWQDYVSLIRQNTNQSVVEEYWGLWSAMKHITSQTPVDATIHALGDVRNRFQQVMFHLPDIVITTRRSLSIWQTWNISANYWFYQKLLEHYYPTIVSPTTLLWRRQENTYFTNADCSITDNGKSLTIYNSNPWSYYELDSEIRINSNSRTLLLVKNYINYAAKARGFLSLPITQTKHKFPVLAEKPGVNSYTFKFVGSATTLDNSSYHIKKCTARKILHQYPDFFAYNKIENAKYLTKYLKKYKYGI